MIRTSIAATLLVASAALLPAQAKTMKDCAADWQTMKTAGKTTGLKYQDFSKQCMAGTAGAAATAPATKPVTATAAKPLTVAPANSSKTATVKAIAPAKVAAAPVAKPAATVAAATQPKPVATAVTDPSLAENQPLPAPPTMAAPAGVIFPKAINAKYASEATGKARLHTCVDAYHANKAANSLGGLQWIQKGGGFYSLCNAALKS